MTIYCPKECQDHVSPARHPESEQRLARLRSMLKADYSLYLSERASPAPLGLIGQHHSVSILDLIRDNANALKENISSSHSMIDSDTYLSPDSKNAIEHCGGAIEEACEKLIDEHHIFCATRPPGHHAEFDKAMGFCFINWAFLAAKKLQNLPPRPSLNRVLILDFDVHHGNGTDDLVRKNCLNDQMDIAYISLHESPLFPNTGLDIIEAEYPSNILNIPYKPKCSSADFWNLWDAHIPSFIKEFSPDAFVISAGFDAHMDDPLSSTQLTEDDFERIGRTINGYDIPSLSILEGGYNLDALEISVSAYLDGLFNL